MSISTSAERESPPIGPARRHEPAHRLTAPRWRRPRIRLFSMITALGLVVALLLTASIAGMAAFGYRALAIRSGSMAPTLHTGDLVISRSEAAGRIRPGDIITFRSPSVGGALLTHRVVSVARTSTSLNVVTKGDANSETESWSIGASGRLGLAVGHVRFVGWWFTWLQSGTGRIALICLACLWVVGVAVPRIWANS